MTASLRSWADRLGMPGLLGVVCLALALLLSATWGRTLLVQRGTLQAQQPSADGAPRKAPREDETAAAQLALPLREEALQPMLQVVAAQVAARAVPGEAVVQEEVLQDRLAHRRARTPRAPAARLA